MQKEYFNCTVIITLLNNLFFYFLVWLSWNNYMLNYLILWHLGLNKRKKKHYDFFFPYVKEWWYVSGAWNSSKTYRSSESAVVKTQLQYAFSAVWPLKLAATASVDLKSTATVCVTKVSAPLFPSFQMNSSTLVHIHRLECTDSLFHSWGLFYFFPLLIYKRNSMTPS